MVERIEDREGSIKKGQETISNTFPLREIISNFLSVNHESKDGGTRASPVQFKQLGLFLRRGQEAIVRLQEK